MEQTGPPPDLSRIRESAAAASKMNEQQVRDELKRKDASLTKLWDAYEIQERDLEKLKERISYLENALASKENAIQTLKQFAEGRDGRARDTELELVEIKRFKDDAEPKIRSLESQLRASEERYTKVLRLWEATYETAQFWRKAAEERDSWFDRHIGAFGDFKRALDERETMLRKNRQEAEQLSIAERARKAALQASEPSSARGKP